MSDIYLQDLKKSGSAVLVDTCIMNGEITERREHSIKELTTFSLGSIRFIEKFYPTLNTRSQFYATPGVYDELTQGRAYHLKRKIKRVGSFEGKDGHDRELLEYYRTKDLEIRLTRQLGEKFKETERILAMTRKESLTGIKLSEQYGWLRYEKRFKNLTDTDLDLVITGNALALNGNPVIIATNDFEVLNAGSFISKREGTTMMIRYFFKPRGFIFKEYEPSRHRDVLEEVIPA